MLATLRNSFNWLPGYLLNTEISSRKTKPAHVFFAICDHFEPYFGNVDAATARKRISKWLDHYPRISEKVRDADGKWLRYSFFYPEEEYTAPDMAMLTELCRGGY